MQAGREWELLVAQLESLFSGPGFRVQSPESIRGKGGNVVKVDVTVRGKVGTQDVLIAFEVRDRGTTPGPDWVQQLAGRRASIGASEIVAVSRDGFSKDAIREASYHGVTLRTLSRFDPAEVADMVLGIELQLERAKYQASGFDLSSLRTRQFLLSPLGPELPRVLVVEHLRAVVENPTTPYIVDAALELKVSLVDLVAQAQWAEGFAGGYFDGRREYRAVVPAEFEGVHGFPEPRHRMHLDELGQGVYISGMAFVGAIWWEQEPVRLSRVLQYEAEGGVLATLAEFDLSPHGVPDTVQLLLDRDHEAAGA